MLATRGNAVSQKRTPANPVSFPVLARGRLGRADQPGGPVRPTEAPRKPITIATAPRIPDAMATT